MPKNVPKNIYQKVSTAVGVVLFFFGLWQMDIISVGPVWSTSWTEPTGGYFNQAFEFGRIDGLKFLTTVGVAYDLCQAFMVIGLLMVLLGLWLWED